MEQKTNYLFGMHPVFEAISAGKNIEKVLLKKGLNGEQFQQLFSLLQEKQIAFQFVPVEKLDKITRARHQGVIAVIPSVDYVSLEDAVDNLNESVHTQSEKNRVFYEKIGDHETRLCLLEVGEGRKESGNGN